MIYIPTYLGSELCMILLVDLALKREFRVVYIYSEYIKAIEFVDWMSISVYINRSTGQGCRVDQAGTGTGYWCRDRDKYAGKEGSIQPKCFSLS